MNPSVRPLAHNFALGMKYQSLNDVEIDCLGGAAIQRSSSDLTYRFANACHGIHYPIDVMYSPPAHEFLDVKARFQL